MAELFRQVEAAILEAEPQAKCKSIASLYLLWQGKGLAADPQEPVLAIDDPGRPDAPLLVDPRKLERRSVATEGGRIRLLHAFAHIEFNAMNIALDAVYRFRDLPAQYISDWLLVASE